MSDAIINKVKQTFLNLCSVKQQIINELSHEVLIEAGWLTKV